MNTQLSLTVLRIVLGVVVGFYAALLTIHQIHGQTHVPLLVLAIAELVAAVLFLIPPTMRIGGIGLVAVFVVAAAFHLLHGEYDVAYLAIYAAAAYAVISGK